MVDSSDDLAERSSDLQELALTTPSEVSLDELHEIFSTPTVAPNTHGAAIVALLNVARAREDIGHEFGSLTDF